MKNYLIAETYGLGDKLYTDSLVKELLSRADTGKVAMLVSKAGGSLRMPFYGERVELLPMEFAWNRRRAQRNPLRLLRSIFAPRIAFGSRFSGYVGLCPRGDLWQRLILRLLGAAPIISYGYSRGEGFLERILGRSREPVMEARISFARQIAPDILPKPGFLRDTSAPARRGEVFLAPEASDPKRELEESKWVQISRELRKNGWKTVLVVHANTAVSRENFGEFSEVADLPVQDLIRRAQGVGFAVAVDSFMGHLLAARGAGVVSIFGPQRPDVWAPAAERRRVVYKKFPCSPCGKELSECPLYRRGKNCMQSVSAEDVIAAFYDLAGGERP